MTGLQAKLKQFFYPMVSVSLVLSCSIGIATFDVQAKTKSAVRGFRPSSNRTYPKMTSSNTRRGSCEKPTEPDSLTPLAPVKYVEQSVSKRPTFFWYVPDQKSYPLVFQLWKSDSNGANKRPYQVKMQSRPGLMQASLPIDQPELETGVVYYWRVVLICQPESPSKNLATEHVHFQAVAPSSELRAELSKTQDPQRQIELYAQNGFWYDALALAMSHDQPLKDSSITLDLLNSLELPEGQKSWTDRLKLIGEVK